MEKKGKFSLYLGEKISFLEKGGSKIYGPVLFIDGFALEHERKETPISQEHKPCLNIPAQFQIFINFQISWASELTMIVNACLNMPTKYSWKQSD